MVSSAAAANDNNIHPVTDEVQLRAAVQSAVLQIVRQDEETTTAGLESSGNPRRRSGNNKNSYNAPNIRFKNSAILTLSELVYLYATQCLGPDLVAFAQHAANNKRKHNNSSTTSRVRISADDVLLVARRNPAGLRDKLQDFLAQRKANQESSVVDVTSSKVTSRRKSAKAAKMAPMDSSSSEDEDLKQA